MKTLILLLMPIALFGQSSEKVRGYRKKNGTTVHSYRKTTPNSTKKDNYSHKGNTNPYTGKKGYKK
jgi:hypothetical protein